MKNKEQVSKAIGALLTQITRTGTVGHKTDYKRITQLRFSSFPFCGLYWFLKLPESIQPHTRKDFGFAYFTSVGTTVHNVFQEAIQSIVPADTRLLHDYVCRRYDCGHRHRLRFKAPKACTKCKGELFEAAEVEVSLHGAKGHIDQILVWVDDDGEMHLIVIDYKTTTSQKVNSKKGIPYKENISQIRSYCAALTDEGYSVSAFVLIYIPRDNPFMPWPYVEMYTDAMYKKDVARIAGYKEQHDAWTAVQASADAIALLDQRPCQDPLDVPEDYADCEYCKLCTLRDTKKLQQKLTETSTALKGWLPINQLNSKLKEGKLP